MVYSFPQALLWFLLLALLVVRRLRVVEGSGENNIATPARSGDYLTPLNDTLWLSPSKTFALGFLPASSSSPSPSLFSLSIFYFQLPQPEKTVVWTVQRGSLVSANATLQLTSQGDLVLTDVSGGGQVWSSNTSRKGVVSATVSDNGSLVLSDASSAIVWSSWNETPTDTLLPGQSLLPWVVIGLLENGLTDGTGKYFACVQDGNLVLFYLASQGPYIYWKSSALNSSATQVYFDSSGGLVLLNDTAGQVVSVLLVSPSSAGQSPPSQRIVMTEKGVLTLYELSTDRTSWAAFRQIPADVCSVMSLCGAYAICSSDDPQDITNYTCSCPGGFEFVDPQDWSLGCRPNNPIDCDSGTQMVAMPGVQYALWHKSISTSQGQCVQDCNVLCYCAAVGYDGQTCYLILEGEMQGGNRLSKSMITYIKIPAINTSSTTSPSTDSKGRVLSTPAAVGLGVGLFLALVLAVSLVGCTVKWLKLREGDEEEDPARALLAGGAPGPVHFSYKELRAATNGFSRELGRGGFGPVYKGVLAGGTAIAVKILQGSNFGEKQFTAEVQTIGSIHHVNLVRLRGFCVSGLQHRLLVYDLMPNGSLDKHIFHRHIDLMQNQEDHSVSDVPPVPRHDRLLLDWPTRFEIVLGTARAIKYLHEDCQPGIVHCDIKPENILLDEDFTAKVSDFGMAQLVGGDFTGSITRARGTPGYMAPEWMSSKRITSKADVYSFGVVILEILSGRRSIDTELESASMVELTSWAYNQFVQRDNSSAIVDPHLLLSPPHHGTLDDAATLELRRSALVAFWCLQKDPSIRPSMGRALQMLEGLVPIDPHPSPI